jgi:hypothetical protein
VLTLLPATWALALTSTTVSFQNGVNGYSGTFDRYINDGTSSTTSPVIAQTDGSVVQSYTLNGYSQSVTQDSQGLIRFDNIFGASAGQIPSGAYILDAKLQIVTEGGATTTPTGNPTGQSNAGATPPTDISGTVGPFGVSGLLQPFSSATDYYTDFPNPGDPFGGRGPYYTANSGAYATRPVGSFGTTAVGQAASARVTSLVQQWSSGTLANNGMAIQAGFDGAADDWQIHTTGYTTPQGRPKLTVTYTTDPITVNTFQPGVGTYAASNVTMAKVVGGASPVTTDGSTITAGSALDGPDATTSDALALIKFNAIFGNGAGQAPSDKPVAKAWLVLSTSTGANSRTNDAYDVDVMKTAWNTGTLYNQFGATPGLQFADGDITPSIARNDAMTNGSEVWYDVTSYVESVRNGATDNGLSVRARGTDGWTTFFNGATDTSMRPRLVIASQTSASLQGDFNNDTKVDAQDYVAWRKGVVPSTPANYALWRANYGNTGSPASAPAPATLVNYDEIGIPNSVVASYAATETATGLNGLTITRGAGVNGTATLTNGFSASGWDRGASASLATAVSHSDYFQFGVSTDATHGASLSTLDLALRRSAAGSPSNYELQVSLDGFATAGSVVSDFIYKGRTSGNAPEPSPLDTNAFVYMSADVAGQPNATTSYGDQIPTIDLSTFAFLQNLGVNQTVTFRLYAWGDATTAATSTVALGRMNGPRIMGFVFSIPGAGASLAAVPEPSAFVLVSIIGIAFGGFGRHRRNVAPCGVRN